MEIAEKLKETALSILPIWAIVLLCGTTFARLPFALLWWFCAASVLVTAGLTVFLAGVDLGVSGVGERCGAALTERRSLALLAGVALAIGVVVTVAEPDIQVFGDQVAAAFPGMGKGGVVLSIAGGVGLFMALGVARMAVSIPLKAALFALYGGALALMALAPRAAIAVAFDSGGATTGPMTVPFIMALGLGVSSVRGSRDGGFGLTGIASAGPLVAMLAYAAFRAGGGQPQAAAAADGGSYGLSWPALGHVARDVAVSVLPLYGMALAMQPLLLKMTRRQFARATAGFAQTAIGLFLFFAGVRCGFMEAGRAIGLALGGRMASGGLPWHFAAAAMGLAIGGIVVCAEPAVWVLGDQVEQTSGGTIRRRALLTFLAVASALAVALSMLRAALGIHIAWFIVPGYAAALAMMPFSPSAFTGIAFDSGGVASGPVTTTFVLPFAMGVAAGSGCGEDPFGVIAMVAMTPLLAIQAMGIAVEARRRGSAAGEKGEVAS